MAALVAGIHVLNATLKTETWMAGTNPAMTNYRLQLQLILLYSPTFSSPT